MEYSPNLSTHSSQIFEVLYVLVMCLYGLKQLLLLRFAFCVWDDTVAILELQLIRFWILFMSRSRRPIRWMDHDGPRWTTMDRGSARAWLARDVQYGKPSRQNPEAITKPSCRVVVIFKDFLWELQVLQS